MNIAIPLTVVFIVAFAANLILTPVIIHLAHRKRWYDRHDHRKIHNGPVPRLGGVGMILATIIALLVGTLLSLRGILPPFVLPVVAGALLVFHILGLVDDFLNVPARRKLLVQVLGAAIVALGMYLQLLWYESGFVPGGPALWAIVLLAFLWTLSVTNAVNLIDGMDGLAGGVAAVAVIAAAITGISIQDAGVAMFGTVFAGAVLAFLMFNRPPASIFMGDCGSLFLGGAIAVTPLLAGSFHGFLLTFLVLLAALAIPGVDTAFSIFRRIRRGVAIHAPDRGHVHHKLMELGWGVPTILVAVYGTAIVAAGVTLVAGLSSLRTGAFIALGMWVVVGGAFLVIGALHQRQALGVEPHELPIDAPKPENPVGPTHASFSRRAR